MFASYRFGFSKSLYGSDGDFSLNNTLKLPENEKSFELFKAAIFKAVEENLPLMFNTFVAGQKLQKELEAQAADEASLFKTEPNYFEKGIASYDEMHLPSELYENDSENFLELETQRLADQAEDEDPRADEWFQRYGRCFTSQSL